MLVKDLLQDLVKRALDAMQGDGVLPGDLSPNIQIERTRSKEHGDFATNVALTLAKVTKRNPRELAEAIIDALPEDAAVEKVEVAGPGFINFFLAGIERRSVVERVLEQGNQYGHSTQGGGQTVNVEFVSANPTGPLHVGHGRGAAYGATLANLLDATGYKVQREYYVNDYGRQMNILATSVWLRYLERNGEPVVFPSNGYRGDYIYDIADTITARFGDELQHPWDLVTEGVPADAPDGDKEVHIDALIGRAKTLLGDTDYMNVFDLALNIILDDIKDDLREFRVEVNCWFSERSLEEADGIKHAIDRLREAGQSYEKDGALWFRATDFGDDKDRVLVRANGQSTYFASDCAYMLNKRERGADTLIYVFGADHHGYVTRLRFAGRALGINPDDMEIPLVQFATLYRGGKKVQMSTRSGQFVTLRELRNDVGNDAARFFYIMRGHEQHLEFDLDLAKSQSNDNPVYYIQYAHARICSVFRELAEKGWSRDADAGMANLELLGESHEEALFTSLARYPELVLTATHNRTPHMIAHYLRDLANDLHTYYNAHKFLVDEAGLRDARLNLILAVKQVIANGLDLLGVSAPESM